jgi:hypothetical protein
MVKLPNRCRIDRRAGGAVIIMLMFLYKCKCAEIALKGGGGHQRVPSGLLVGGPVEAHPTEKYPLPAYNSSTNFIG